MICRKNLTKMMVPWMALFFLFLAAACSQKDDVQVIRGLIKEGAELAEDHNVSGIMELTTEDVVALPGHHNRMEIKRIIFAASGPS
jgi:hypothetical protein